MVIVAPWVVGDPWPPENWEKLSEVDRALVDAFIARLLLPSNSQ